MRITTAFFLYAFTMAAQGTDPAAGWEKDDCLKNASIAYSVRDARTGSVITEYQPWKNLVPASALKILTTGAALSILGENFRYETSIVYSGEIISGVLRGDLIIRGSGDPSLHSAYFSNKIPITDQWAAAVRKSGISEITGSIIGDASKIAQHINSSWLWEDVSNYFGAAPCGLNYNDNRFSIFFSSGANGSAATLTACSPRYLTQDLSLTSNVISRGKEDLAYVYGDPLSYVKNISGSIPPEKKKYKIEAALPDPALLCAEQLYSSLVSSGIKCDSKKIRSNYSQELIPEATGTIITTTSPPLKDLVHHTNQHSDNLYCEAILRTLGKNTLRSGISEVKKFWHANGIDSSAFYMADACGLARSNTVNTGSLSRVLCALFKQAEVYKTFYASLPAAGKEGSMSLIGKGTAVEGNLRAKTGYMHRVRSYAGYLTTRAGKELAFSIIFNNYDCSAREARERMNKFMSGLYEL